MRDKNGRIRWSFRPAVSNDALKRLGEEVRSWRLRRRVDLTVEVLAKRINPIVAGWTQYYGRFFRSALYPLLVRINTYLVRWLRNKYKRFRAMRKAIAAFQRAAKCRPGCPRSGSGRVPPP
ncbi:group II intron maturase-specific domain-containing protein [Streptomyces sp. NPDC101149]|uniref:group II intron maturase-specific domain-containing protein n=1 Tax=Streptomyces sp. NPDC101149 TaxID=3366113 RepID=UPI00382F6B59